VPVLFRETVAEHLPRPTPMRIVCTTERAIIRRVHALLTWKATC